LTFSRYSTEKLLELKFGYVLSSIILFCGVLAILLAWYRTTGKIEFEDISTRQSEIFYWVTILVSNTLGTALGDFVATDVGLGFGGGAIVFSGLLVIVILAHFFTNIKAKSYRAAGRDFPLVRTQLNEWYGRQSLDPMQEDG